MRTLVSVLALSAASVIGCGGSPPQVDALESLPHAFNNNSWQKVIPALQVDRPEVNELSPSQAVQLITALKTAYGGTYELKRVTTNDRNTATKRVRAFQIYKDGAKLGEPFEIYALHAGNNDWKISTVHVFNALYAGMELDRMKRYKGMAEALRSTGLPFYGRQGRYVTANRIDQLVAGKLTFDTVGLKEKPSTP